MRSLIEKIKNPISDLDALEAIDGISRVASVNFDYCIRVIQEIIRKRKVAKRRRPKRGRINKERVLNVMSKYDCSKWINDFELAKELRATVCTIRRCWLELLDYKMIRFHKTDWAAKLTKLGRENVVR